MILYAMHSLLVNPCIILLINKLYNYMPFVTFLFASIIAIHVKSLDYCVIPIVYLNIQCVVASTQ